MVDMLGHLHRIDGEFDVHVALHLRRPSESTIPWSACDDRIAIVVEPVDQRADGRIFLIFDQPRYSKTRE